MEQVMVSILIRTCQRPDVLRTALESVRNQTYPNIQVVVVEDGENTAEKLLETEFSDLNYVFEATGNKVGRCVSGNRAMELASGKYFNFLDDDDALFPEHVECLINALREGEELAAYSLAEERRIQIISQMPYVYRVKRKSIRFRQPFHRLLLYTFNYIPIQCMMFHRNLYEMLGGLDPELDNLEDWDLWVRYSAKTDYAYVDRVTSCYHVPYNSELRRKRSTGLSQYQKTIDKKFETYRIELNVEDLHKEMIYVIREYKEKGIIRYLRMFFRAVFYGEK